MNINIYILIGILLRVAGIILLLQIIPKQIREVKRPKNSFTHLRWRLLVSPILIVTILLITLPRSIHLIHRPVESTSEAIQAIAINLGIVVLCENISAPYKYKPSNKE